MTKTQINLVEVLSDQKQAFDQACRFENRVGSHGTYCHNVKMTGMRKCHYRFTSAKQHEACEGYEANPAYGGEWELPQ